MREYGILRHAIIASADASWLRLTNAEFDALGKRLSDRVAEAALEYSRERDRELAAEHDNLDFLASAGELLSSSLDYGSTLSRLTRLIVPRLADCCAVHLDSVAVDDMPIAHVDPAKSELARCAAVAIDNARLYLLAQQERSRVEAATRAKDEFVAVVSYELRTPLNAILGWVRLLRSGSLSEAKKEHALEVIERNANAQNQLVSELLDISHAISGKVRIYPAQVDLSNIVDICLEEAHVALDAKRLQVHTELNRAGSVMRGDGERLQQIVWNLIRRLDRGAQRGSRQGGHVRGAATGEPAALGDAGSASSAGHTAVRAARGAAGSAARRSGARGSTTRRMRAS